MGTEKCIVILETSEIRITCMLFAIPYHSVLCNIGH